MALMLIRHFGSMISHHLRANHDHAGHDKQQSQQRRPHFKPVAKIDPAHAQRGISEADVG